MNGRPTRATHRTPRALLTILTFLAILAICLGVALLSGCRETPGGQGPSGDKNPTKRSSAAESTDKRPSTFDLADKAIRDLGDEKAAFLALLIAWDRGFSLEQIVTAIQSASLSSDGNIDGEEPAGRRKAALRVLLVSLHGTETADQGSADARDLVAALPPGFGLTAEELIELDKAVWTRWLMGVMAVGYSAEQITEYMVLNPEPAGCGPDEAIPCIMEEVKDSKTGELVMRIVRPAFLPPEFDVVSAPRDGSYGDKVTAESLQEDFVKDMEALLEREPASAARPGDSGSSDDDSAPSDKEPASTDKPGASATGFTAATLKPKLEPLVPGSFTALDSYDLTLRISDKGAIEGSYELATKGQGETRKESGSFSGQAAISQADQPTAYFKLDGSEKLVATSDRTGNTRRDDDDHIPGMFQGNLSLDSTTGSGTFYARSMLLKWTVGP